MLERINKSKRKTRPQNCKPKIAKENVLNNARALPKGKETVYKVFESGVFLKSEELKQSKKEQDVKY